MEDKDKDGYIDDVPFLNPDGTTNNTEYKYAEIEQMLLDAGKKVTAGYQDTTSHKNMNVVKPPEFVKILSNVNGYKFYVRNTGVNYLDEEKRISNGLHNGAEENWRGYYGSTKFYYGPGEKDYYEGPPQENELITNDPEKNWYDWYVFY